MSTKYETLLPKLTTPSVLTEEITMIFYEEYSDLFENILTFPENEFKHELLIHIKSSLIENYSSQAFENQKFISLYNSIENHFFQNVYLHDKLFLEKEYNKIQSQPSTADTFFFRKHCIYQDNTPLHCCNNMNNFKIIYTNKTEEKSISNIYGIICLNCKFVYRKDYIKLNCNFCYISYYSCIENSNNNNNNIQPATWEKYHCSLILNEQMKCINCFQLLYLDIQNNLLTCQSCDFKADPYDIMWKCLKCNQGFYSNAKIYNPYEYKPLALAIKKALYEKISALPKYLPCGHSASGIRHKKECNGEMYVAYLNDRKMIMCYKCRALTKYKKFIFKCTICGKRFRDDGCFEKYNNNNNEIEKGIDNSRNLSKRTSSKGKSLISVEDKIKSSSNNSNDDTTVITSSKTFSVGNLNTIKLQYYSLHEKTNINIFNDNNNTNNNTNSQSSFQIPQESKSERNIPTLFNSNDENEQSINSSLITLNQKYSHEQQLPDEDIQIPSFDLNNYDNISQIGQGKLSKILCVKESDTLNFFALKKEITKTKFKHDKILNNISIQYKLSNISEHITKIYNINTTQEDEISILEELGINNFENEILSNKKIKNFYTEIHLIKILSQIINALEILHMNNYAHFNINPNNILLFNDNVYKLNDFGNIQRISQEHFSLTLDELLENKYISPQINLIIKRVSNRKNALINSKEINFLKEDIYSLGLTILSVLIPISEPIPMLNEFINVDGRVIRMDKYNKYIKDKVKKYIDFANGIVGEINKKFLYSERIEELLCGMLNLKEENRMTVKEIKEFIIENYMNEE